MKGINFLPEEFDGDPEDTDPLGVFYFPPL